MPELRDTNYYADQVAARYPLLDKKAVRRICRYIMRQVGTLAAEGEDVLLQSARYGVTLKLYTPDFDAARHNRENWKRRKQRFYMREGRLKKFGTGSRTRAEDVVLKKIV